MNKEEIKKACLKSTSKDINGELQNIYDFDKVYQMVTDKAYEWLMDNIDFEWNWIVKKFKNYMEK